MAAGRKPYGEQGFAGVTTLAIATAAGLTRGALDRQFDNTRRRSLPPLTVDRHVIPQGCRHGIPQVRASMVCVPCPRWRCLADAASGPFAGPVAGSVHEDLVAAVDDPVE
ncbi:helix-turn-helix domain-containing protein [Mycobacterium lacus]